METGALWRWAAAVGFAAGGLIAACWVSAELGGSYPGVGAGVCPDVEVAW